MRITAINRRRAQWYEVVWEDDTVWMLDVRTVDESGYTVGSVLTEEERSRLKEQSARRRAREKALYLLSVQDRSRAELQRKLQPECGEELAEEMAQQMEQLGLINDTEYAFRLARDLMLVKLVSGKRALQELQMRGIDRDLAQEAVAAVETTDLQQALALLKKKRYNGSDDERERRRITDFLLRRGFSYETVRRALAWDDTEGM